ncbi:hypothetical protein C8R46DRAFT_1350931 [Mycena filopes]|nr:hypothetical protein C8R46DRAFT_1350931 [Mycena filopes]
MPSSAGDLASDLVTTALPTLTTRLRKYDDQNYELQLRYEALEHEIARVKRSIAYKQAQQVRFVEDLNYERGHAKSSFKRQRTEDEAASRPRIEDFVDQLSAMCDSDSESATIGMKRKERFFSNEEKESAENF